MPTKTEIQEKSKELLDLLRNSENAVEEWNRQYSEPDFLGFSGFQGTDFSSIQLPNITMRGLKLAKCNFNNANLENSAFSSTDLTDATFVAANCKDANFYKIIGKNVNFSDAQLQGAQFYNAKLPNANLERADLSKVRLWDADLRGANLTDCKIEGTEFYKAVYDEHTRLPSNLSDVEWKKMKYKGKVPDPFKQSKKQSACSTGPVDFPAFVKHVEENFDSERIKKALSMLKKETFQLFSEVTDDGVMGIVKSQTDKDLVYSCRLGSDGTFACCTQNLKNCGGLRGSLCKHIIVLVIGLTKAGQLTPTNSAQWMLSSMCEKPELDKDQMAETFLKYKGVESGEVDWRPMETTPEDYYAF